MSTSWRPSSRKRDTSSTECSTPGCTFSQAHQRSENLALEDDEGRLQDRVYEFIDVPTENLEFAIASEYIDSGLENQIRTLGETHDNLKLVIIDTMQKVRETTDMSYAKDYKDMSVLKDLATKRGNVCKPDQERTQPTGHFV